MSLGLETALYFAAALFSVGVYGILARQNLLVILMSLEILLNAVNLALAAFGRAFLTRATDTAAANGPQVFVLIVLAVAAAEAAVGLSLLLAVYRLWRSARAQDLNTLKG